LPATSKSIDIPGYGVEKTVDTHKILINAIKFYVCLQEI
jgi:hypothetical protein